MISGKNFDGMLVPNYDAYTEEITRIREITQDYKNHLDQQILSDTCSFKDKVNEMTKIIEDAISILDTNDKPKRKYARYYSHLERNINILGNHQDSGSSLFYSSLKEFKIYLEIIKIEKIDEITDKCQRNINYLERQIESDFCHFSDTAIKAKNIFEEAIKIAKSEGDPSKKYVEVREHLQQNKILLSQIPPAYTSSKPREVRYELYFGGFDCRVKIKSRKSEMLKAACQDYISYLDRQINSNSCHFKAIALEKKNIVTTAVQILDSTDTTSYDKLKSARKHLNQNSQALMLRRDSSTITFFKKLAMFGITVISLGTLSYFAYRGLFLARGEKLLEHEHVRPKAKPVKAGLRGINASEPDNPNLLPTNRTYALYRR